MYFVPKYKENNHRPPTYMAAMHRNIGNSVPIKKSLPDIGNSKPIRLTPGNVTHMVSGGIGSSGSGPKENLPKQFVSAMRTLFDIMDDKRTGYVRLSDIEHRWQDDGAKGLPHGVIDSLRKVTPLNGMLSFERFCAGLKICLLRNQSDSLQSSPSSMTTPPKVNRRTPLIANNAVLGSSTENPLLKELKSQRPPSVPLLDLENAIPTGGQHWKSGNTAAVRPNNAISGVQRALSLPKLSLDSDDPDHISTSDLPLILPGLYAPPKPPRTALVLGNGVTNINHLDRLDKAEIRHALQNWQMGVLMNEMDAKDKRMMVNLNRGTADGSNDVGQQQQQQSQPKSSTGGIFQKKANARRREPRRHTLQNGIDYNTLKKLKQLEQEKDVLLQGLGAVENAHSWYLKQISLVQDKIKQLGKMGSYVVSRVCTDLNR